MAEVRQRFRLTRLLPLVVLVLFTLASSFLVWCQLPAEATRSAAGLGSQSTAGRFPVWQLDGFPGGGDAHDHEREGAREHTGRPAGDGSAAAASEGRFSLTIITQTTPDKLRFLREMADRWEPHPLVAAVYLPSDTTVAEIEKSLRAGGRPRRHVRLVFRRQARADEQYPINALRNLALGSARSTHVLNLDADLWPSSGLHAAFAAQSASVLTSARLALVVPAFAFYAANHSVDADAAFGAQAPRLPHTVPQLQACMRSGRCSTFYARSSPETHSSTDYPKWWACTEPGASLPIGCIRSLRYEPYVILPRLPSTPTYAEQFTGYGKNKIAYIAHLRHLGFRFAALPLAFVTHMQHGKSELKRRWEDNATRHRQKMDALFSTFIQQLKQQKQPVGTTPSCGHSHAYWRHLKALKKAAEGRMAR